MKAGRPRLGFLGLGWIGRSRMQALAQSGVAQIAAIADPDPAALTSAREIAPQAAAARSLQALLDHELDGVVIATPSALHAEQALAALERGLAVFCQKPLGRSAGEAGRVVSAARAADRLLAVDLSYRETEAMARISERIWGGELGDVYAVNLVFHNAYGPDKPWFYDRASAGGGALMDLGVHLIDLGLWVLGFPRVTDVSSRLFAGGRALADCGPVVEDHALASLGLASGGTLQLACSWKLHAGCDCVIDLAFHGTRGGARFSNVGGSFYDFRAELFSGTARRPLAEPPDAWGGRALVRWASRLAEGAGFDPDAEQLLASAAVIDRIYQAAGAGAERGS